MLTDRELSEAIGTTAYGPDGATIGTVEHFLVDDRTGAPTWVAVSTGLFGVRHSVVPALDATFADGGLHLTVTRDAVRSAPSMSGDHLDPAEEARLREHYGVAAGGRAARSTGVGTGTTGTRDERGDGPGGGGAMVRSEEHLRVRTERVPIKRVRVVKYVVTEEVQVTVPLRREEIRIEEVPIDEDYADGNDRQADHLGTAAGRLPEEIVLRRERPVVTVEAVAAERVRLRIEQVTGSEQVSEQVQRERIAVDEPGRSQADPAESGAAEAEPAAR